ncbi:MAG: type I-E CRISPR-associated endonuclease Cas1 [Telmatospirillum sp.]|nr:type I-E CRISPR-associated endonuclease Cas1 [Telmatospirillum sp.]
MLKGRLGIDEARIPQKSRNGLIYVERCRLSIDNGSLVLSFDEAGREMELPYQLLNVVLVGPGGVVTHDAVRHLSAHGTCIAFVGTGGTRLYTAPPLFDRDAGLARKQAMWWAGESTRMMVAKRMYEKRFGETPRTTSFDSLRGMEAARIKKSYELIAQRFGVDWKGRRFDRSEPDSADPPNQAINHVVTAVEACVAIAVQATATLAPLGFLHDDSAKSWILDLCDLYRTSVTVPLAFQCVKRQEKEPSSSLDRLCRHAVSRHVREKGFIDTVIDDIKDLLA